MEVIKKISNLLVSQRCSLCGELLQDVRSRSLCNACTNLLLFSNISSDINCCSQCGMPLISETGRCLRCRTAEINYLSNKSLFIYSGQIKELIYQYKFKGKKNISFLLAQLVYEYILRNNFKDVIVPVPGRKIVKREQGWEHIDLIAKILLKKYNLPVLRLLTRTGKKAQKTLNIEKRAHNLRRSIKIIKKVKLLPHSVILLDDVFTTGTTINECALILKQAGVKKISSLTIAID